MRAGWIEDRGDRGLRWRARYRGPDGLVRSRSFATKVSARRWLTDQQSKIDQASWVTPELGRIGWADYSEQLQAGRSHLAARTVETDRRCHERVAELIGDVQLIRLTPDLLRKLTSELAGRYAPETVARTMRWVRLTLNQAVRERRISGVTCRWGAATAESPDAVCVSSIPRRMSPSRRTPGPVLSLATWRPSRACGGASSPGYASPI